jgi:hypothetical protein
LTIIFEKLREIQGSLNFGKIHFLYPGFFFFVNPISTSIFDLLMAYRTYFMFRRMECWRPDGRGSTASWAEARSLL